MISTEDLGKIILQTILGLPANPCPISVKGHGRKPHARRMHYINGHFRKGRWIAGHWVSQHNVRGMYVKQHCRTKPRQL